MMIVIVKGTSLASQRPDHSGLCPTLMRSQSSPSLMLQATAARIGALVPLERIWVIAPSLEFEFVVGCLPDVPSENIMLVPPGQESVAAIGLAAQHQRCGNPHDLISVVRAEELFASPDFLARYLAETDDPDGKGETVLIWWSPSAPAGSRPANHLPSPNARAWPRQILRQ